MNADAHTTPPPAILVVSADEEARSSVVVPLNRRYAQDYRILDAATPAIAASMITQLHEEGGRLALVLADDPSPTEDHETVFAAARRSFPDVRRGLIIEWGSWADAETTEAVLRLMSRVQIDYYVVRPGHTADESFHRAITDFLHEWEYSSGKRRRGFAVIGERAKPRTHQLQTMLARGGIPAERIDPSSAEASALLEDAGLHYEGSPIVRTAEGFLLVDPDDAELARSVGLDTSLPERVLDVVIVGAGPGGLAAAVYSASEGLDTLELEGE
jgi:thioredoxin reductase (NADPH)